MTETILNQRQQKVLERREGIIEQARALFIREGLANVTMQDVMNETGIAKATMYRYFDSIHAIALEVQSQMLAEIYGDLVAIEYDHEPEIVLKQVYTRMIDGFESHKIAYRYIGSFDFIYAKAYPETFMETEYDSRLEALVKEYLGEAVQGDSLNKLLVHLGMISSYLQKMALRESIYNQGMIDVDKRLSYLREMVERWEL